MKFKWHPNEPPPHIESHSKAKLRVLRSYLEAYFNTLNVNFAQEHFRIDLVDGFSGGGTFLDNGEIISGSPLILIEEAEAAAKRLNAKRQKPLNFDCKYYFYDRVRAHTDHLKKVMSERGYPINDEKFVIENIHFEYALSKTINEIKRRQPIKGRAIFLLDQTGYSNVIIKQVAQIFDQLPAAEVILTFAVDSLINFLREDSPLIETYSRTLNLSEDKIKDLHEMRDGVGGKALVQRTLREHFRTFTGADYDTPFFLRPKISRRALWFLHLSRHPKARDVMIQTHWNTNNTFEHFGPGHYNILGWEAICDESTPPLFSFDEIDARDMKEKLLSTLARKTHSLALDTPVTVDAFRHNIANNTAARFEDIDEVLMTLYGEKEIEIQNASGKLRSSQTKRLNKTDLIAVPRQLILPIISRLNEK